MTNLEHAIDEALEFRTMYGVRNGEVVAVSLAEYRQLDLDTIEACSPWCFNARTAAARAARQRNAS